MTGLAQAIAASPLHTLAVYLLSNVPGFPPIVQTVHLLSIAGIMGTVVIVNLRTLGLAVPSQTADELVRRLMPWVWALLPVLAASGLVFVVAQPHRYFDNPVFRIKFALLAAAIAAAVFIQRIRPAEGAFARVLAAASLCLWIAVVMAGRWIAYADYLWPVE